MHISYHLYSLDCNLADGEYVLIPKQGAVHEEDKEPTPSLPSRISPQPQQLKASPGFMHNQFIYMLLYYT
jgi:hypothetical protein